jgi:hypothetical protein
MNTKIKTTSTTTKNKNKNETRGTDKDGEKGAQQKHYVAPSDLLMSQFVGGIRGIFSPDPPTDGDKS